MPDVQVVGLATHGREAIDRIEQLQPDLVTLDVEMPVLNGIETLREMRRLDLKTPTLMVSSLTQTGAEVTVEALFEGAFDFVHKPSGGSRAELQQRMQEKVEAFQVSRRQHSRKAAARRSSTRATTSETGLLPHDGTQRPPLDGVPRDAKAAARQQATCPLIVVGASTGGPQALRQLVGRLDSDLQTPILIVQHMPAGYTESMAKRLDSLTALQVRETCEGAKLSEANIWVAAGGMHLGFTGSREYTMFRGHDSPPLHGCKPAIDFTMEAAAKHFGPGVLAIVLTGMGRDGAGGCQAIRHHGGTVFAQDEETSAVYGMPKAVVQAGAADRVLPLGRIAPAIARHLKRTHRSRV